MTARIRCWLTALFFGAVLAAFCYGATGCAAAPERQPIPCPERTAMKIRTIVEVQDCSGDDCEMLMLTCFVVPEGGTWRGKHLP